MKKSLIVRNINIHLFLLREEDFISLTDIAKYKNSDDPRFVIQNWMKTRSSVEFLGFWDQINNPDFKRIEFDTFKNEAGSNAFVLTPKKWIKTTGAIGIFLNQVVTAAELLLIKTLLLNLLHGYPLSLSSILLKNFKG